MKTVYEENAFRVLGVAANATWKTVRDVQNKLKLRAKVGGLNAMADPLFFLNTIERNDSTIRDAFNRLDRPETRLLERLFWFTESNPADAKAIRQLGAGEFLESIEIWQSARFISARANLARLLHAVAVMRDPNADDISLWKNAFESWRITLENDAFWQQFENIEKKSGVESVADASEFEDLKGKSWEIILEPSMSLLQKALDRSQYDITARHLDLIRRSGFPNRAIVRIETKVFETFENRVEENVKSILQTLSEALESKQLSSEKKSDCDQAYRRYKSAVLPEVKRLAQLAKIDSETVKRARETAASCLRSISINYHNDAEDLQSSEQLLREALALSKDSIISERIKEDLETVSKNAHQKQDAEKLEKEHDQTINGPWVSQVAVAGNTIRVPSLCTCCLGQPSTEEKISYEWQTGNVKHAVSFSFPVCSDCLRHRRALNLKQMILASASIAGVFACCYNTLNILPTINGTALSGLLLGVLFILFISLNRIFPLSSLGREHGGREQSVRIVTKINDGFIFHFWNPRYATLFAHSNTTVSQKRRIWKHSRSGIFPIVSKASCNVLSIAIIVSSLFCYVLWNMRHALLYIDNGTERHLSLKFHNWKDISAPPGVTTIEIPVGNFKVAFGINVSQISITTGGSWVFNPHRRNHYRRYEVIYGSPNREPKSWYIGNPELIEANDDYIFNSPPKSISTKLSSEIRTVFERVTAHSGQSELGVSILPPSGTEFREFSNDNRKETPNVEIDAAKTELSRLESQLRTLLNNLDSYKTQIKIYATKIEQIEEDIENDEDTDNTIDREEYETLLNRHNYYVERYNAELVRYNNKYAEYKRLRDETNSKVVDYNGRR
ncbi:hypothetical protein L0244_20065 [bacterium]|nr:hypothetical protein [bacterium]MCI0691281.1 hypothetical protein [candidate division KSB1 bacterium]